MPAKILKSCRNTNTPFLKYCSGLYLAVLFGLIASYTIFHLYVLSHNIPTYLEFVKWVFNYFSIHPRGANPEVFLAVLYNSSKSLNIESRTEVLLSVSNIKQVYDLVICIIPQHNN